jgi:ribosomal protein L11 methyltransferase
MPPRRAAPGSGRWLELSVEVGVEAVEAASEILGRVAGGTTVQPTRLIHDPLDELSVRADPDAPYRVTAHVIDDSAGPAAIEATERALWHLQAFGLGPIGRLHVARVAASDWIEAWRRGYVPIRIGRLVIVPSWMDVPIGPDELAIRMDPGMAFGTGLHPTTRGCLSLLQDLDPMPATALDVGCGSGILGIAAIRLGAQRVEACDPDPLAVEATGANARANGVSDRLGVTGGPLAAVAPGMFALVLANLVASLLVELAPSLAARIAARGTLIASGVIAERGEEVVSALQATGLEVISRLDDGEWLTLAARRTPASRLV